MATTATPTQTSRGVWYMIGAAFFWSLMSACVKWAGHMLPSQQIVLVRAVVTLAYSYVLLRWSDVDVWGHNKPLLWLRGLLGFGALSCFFFALTVLPLADATVIHYTNPVLTALIAAPVLGESLRRQEMLGALLSLTGVVCIAQPAFLFGTADLNPLHVGIALLGALLAASAYVVVRRLRATEHPLVVVFYFPLVATLGSVPTTALVADLVWPSWLTWIVLLVGVGGCAQVAQVLLTKGLHAERAGRAMSISYLQIVFAACWGFLLFQEVPDVWTGAGAALVVSGTLLVTQA